MHHIFRQGRSQQRKFKTRSSAKTKRITIYYNRKNNYLLTKNKDQQDIRRKVSQIFIEGTLKSQAMKIWMNVSQRMKAVI